MKNYRPTDKAKKLAQLMVAVWEALDALPGDSCDLQSEDLTDDDDTRDSEYICVVVDEQGLVKVGELYDPPSEYVSRGLLEEV